MATLTERLEAALQHAKKQREDLVRHFVTAKLASRQAVNKWFETDAKNLKMEHLFAVADWCGVEARWLATGKGPMKAGAKPDTLPSDIPQRRIELIRMYGRLPEEVRLPIRQLIETLAWQQHPRKQDYVKSQRKAPDMVHEE